MLLVVIKSTIIIFLLWGIYVLFLERERMHNFNRLFLILILIAGLLIPITKFRIPFASAPIHNAVLRTNIAVGERMEAPEELLTEGLKTGAQFTTGLLENTSSHSDRYWGRVKKVNALQTIYFIGFSFFLIRFLIALFHITWRIHRNTKIEQNEATFVLLNEPITPHSFMKYIFLYERDYNEDRIPKEVIDHELSHVRQYHSIDIIIAELIHLCFWWIPVIPLIKRSIKENHEFLADQAVLVQNGNVEQYQRTLLDSIAKHNYTHLSSTLTFGLTKKRFHMMLKESREWVIHSKRIFLIPLIACFFLGMSNRDFGTRYKSVLGDDYLTNRGFSMSWANVDTELNFKKNEGLKNKFYYRKAYGNDGMLFSGTSNRTYNVGERDHYIEKSIYKDGLLSEYSLIYQDSIIVNRTKYRYNGNELIYRERFSPRQNIGAYSYLVRENGIQTNKIYYNNNQIYYESVFTENENGDIYFPTSSGEVKVYSEEGELIGHEKYENGKTFPQKFNDD